MKYTKDDKIAMTKTNEQLFELADIITDNDYDIYSYVASKIFNKPYGECMEQIDYNWNPTGKIMRDIAKYICINHASVDDLSNTYKIPNLKQLVVDAFPFRFSDDIDDDDISDDLDDRCCGAVTFLTALTGYVRFTKFYESNCKALRKLNCEMMLTDSIKSLIRNRATESGVYDPDRDSIEFSATEDGISVIVTKCDPISRVVFDFTVPDMGFSIRKE